MSIRTSGAARRRAANVGRSLLGVAVLVAIDPPWAEAQQGAGRPAQPMPGANNPYAAAAARARSTPLPARDTTAADRALIAGRVYRSAVEVREPRPAAAAPRAGADLDDVELAERLGRWSVRWREAQDNAARSLAERYQAVSDHRARMSALEEGRSPRRSEPSRLVADIARFFRPVDAMGVDQIIPGVIEVERPLNVRGAAVAPDQRAEIAARVYETILDDAARRFLAARPKDGTTPDPATFFDARLAERLGWWSDLWRQAEDAAIADPAARTAAVRNRSARPVYGGARLADPDARPDTVRSHVWRMTALEEGRSLRDALERAGRPASEPLDRNRLRGFGEVARFFRIEAESQLPPALRTAGPDGTPSARAAAAGRIYRSIIDEAARRDPDASRPAATSLDAALAERLGMWSVRWSRAQADAGRDFGSRYPAIRAHVDRMAALEQAGPGPDGPSAAAPPREFAEVARFIRLEAAWELARVRAR